MSTKGYTTGTYHKMTKTKFYHVWSGMKSRCNNSADAGYKHYGGRGVTVCDRWNHSFVNFYDDMFHTYTHGLSIDRINVNGNYEPGNCRWCTSKQQNRNRRSNSLHTYNGETLCIQEWSERYKINKVTLWDRLDRGWSIEKALTTPKKTNAHAYAKKSFDFDADLIDPAGLQYPRQGRNEFH